MKISASSLFASLNRSSLPRALVLFPYYTLRFIWMAFRENSFALLRYYPGYHGSTIPSLKHIRNHRERIFDTTIKDDGINLKYDQQRALLQDLSLYYADFDPPKHPTEDKLYYSRNNMFGFGDGFFLYGFLRHYKPQRIIEVGSGYSSALMIDTCNDYLPNCSLTFIDPYSTTISDVLLNNNTTLNVHFHREEVQAINTDFYQQLEHNDFLFIDTSHVVKTGSDLSTLLFEVLPSLKKGVIVHIHDIWFPWEYPHDMVFEGRNYNESYFVRAFMQFNDAFEILFFSSMIESMESAYLEAHMPECCHHRNQSLWIRKIK